MTIAKTTTTKQINKAHGNGEAHQLKLCELAAVALCRQRALVSSVCLYLSRSCGPGKRYNVIPKNIAYQPTFENFDKKANINTPMVRNVQPVMISFFVGSFILSSHTSLIRRVDPHLNTR